ncbi:unnamed protein product, partial [marine sediment metagenome]
RPEEGQGNWAIADLGEYIKNIIKLAPIIVTA